MAFRSRLAILILLSVVYTTFADPPQLGWRLDGSAFLRYGQGIETPHTDWATPSALGRLKVLFVVNQSGAYDVPELACRMDLDVRGMPADTWLRLGEWYWLGTWLETSTGSERTAYLEQLLDEPCDVIVLGHHRFLSLSETVQYKILAHVSRGCGLVMFYRHNVDPWLLARHLLDAPRTIARGIPFAGLQSYRDWFMPSRDLLRVSDIAPVLLEACRFGAGRVLIVDYQQQSSVFDGRSGAIVPTISYDYSAGVQYDYHQALAVRCIQWASGRDPLLTWTEDLPDGREIPALQSSEPVQIHAHWSGADNTTLTATCRVRNRWGEVLPQVDRTVVAHPGPLTFACRWPPLGDGVHFVDCIVRSERGIENFASFSLAVRSPLRMDAIKPATDFVELDQPVSGEIVLSRAPASSDAAFLELFLEDGYGRVFSKATVPLPAGVGPRVAFTLPVGNRVAWGARLRARLLSGGKIVHTDEVELRMRRVSRGEYPIAMWGAISGYGNHAGNLQMRKLGFTAVIGDPLAEARDDLGWMTFRHGKGALIHSLGDEIPVPKPAKGTALNAFLQKRYVDIDALNAAWGTTFAGWDQVEPSYAAVNGDAGSFVRMHDCLSCGEFVYANNIRKQRDAIMKDNPPGVVGPEGSPVGDPELTLAEATFWGPYLTVRDNLLVNALGRPGLLRGNWFGGYVEDRRVPTRNRHVLWQSILGGNNVIEYFIISGGLLAPDLTVMPFVEEFLPSWNEIRGGLGQQLARCRPTGNPVALLHSQPSEHIGQAGGAPTDTVKAHECLLNLLGDAGYSPRFVSTSQVRAGALERDGIRVLFLVHAFALADEEIDAIQRFAESGGTVIADIPPAWFDAGCHLRPRCGMDELLGVNMPAPQASLAQQIRRDAAIAPIRTPYGALTLRGHHASRLASAAEPLGDAVARKIGKGRCLLLGGTLWSEAREDPASIATVGRILREWAGVAPPFEVRYEVPLGKVGTKVYSYERGDIHIDAVLPPEATDPRVAVRPTLTWPTRMHTYDLRHSQYLGNVSELTCTVDRATPVVVARLAYEVGELRLTVPPQTPPGDRLTYTCRLYDTTGTIRSEHVLRIRVHDIQGRERPEYAAWLDGDSTVQQGCVALAFNDPAGQWKIAATDIISGHTAEAVFEVTARKPE